MFELLAATILIAIIAGVWGYGRRESPGATAARAIFALFVVFSIILILLILAGIRLFSP